MKCEVIHEEYKLIQKSIIQQDKQERLAIAAATTEVLSKLNVTIDTLPQKCQQLLHTVADHQVSLGIAHLDPISISLLQSKELSAQLDDEYQILKLKQKNEELQANIDRNNKFLEGLRRELAYSRDALMAQSPNPENIQDHVRQLRQKVASYEENCEKAKTKFSKLSIPEVILPKSLVALTSQLATLRAEAASLKLRADDVTLTRQARDTFASLAR